MADIFDYIKWRGDLDISQDSFNLIDAVILSRLSYMQLDGIVQGKGEQISLKAAADIFFSEPSRSERVLWKGDAELLRAASDSARFGVLPLSYYVNIVDGDTNMQFSALTIALGDGRHFISYRGTDNTLVGWREDFDMFSRFPLPSQEKALEYFCDAAYDLEGHFIFGGHSKGGNLAVYSASFCNDELRKRIDAVYSLDGPGFERENLENSGFADICDRIYTFVPQSSMFGMLMEHQEEYTIVQSRRRGFFQHDIYTWEVEGTRLITLPKTTTASAFFDHTLTDFIDGISVKDRERLVDGVFEILGSADVVTFNEMANSILKCVGKFLSSMKQMDSKTRSLILSQLGRLLKTAGKNFNHVNPLRSDNRRSKDERRYNKRVRQGYRREKQLKKLKGYN